MSMQISRNLHTLPYPVDPAQLFVCLRRLPWAMWLDSGRDGDTAGRYHIMVADPVCTLVTVAGETTVTPVSGTGWRTGGEPLAALCSALEDYAGSAHAGEPFAGGAVGYYSYELGRRFEGLPLRSGREPEMAVGIYRWAVVLDRLERRAWLAGPDADSGLAARLEAAATGTNEQPGPFRITAQQPPGMDEAAYARAFGAVQRYIQEGDCYQVNLANRIRAGYEGDPLRAYLWLRERAAGPYSAYLDVPGTAVLSLSPERFLRHGGGQVETRPIKGTRPRRSEAAADAAEAEALLASRKDRAENVMIVDLLRNDLGKVCRPGSVHVPALCELESYSTVHHLVSRVEGELSDGYGPLDLLRACLPGGSITGAPKHRAMQIIDELEGRARGVYCGAIGYLGFDGAMDLNIAIRTATCVDGIIDYWAGGGVVADSECAAEYAETGHKARSFLDLLDAEQTLRSAGGE